MRRILCPALLMALVLAAPIPSATITVGPYIQDVWPDRATIVWETDTAASAEVEFGLTSALGSSESDPTPLFHHEIPLAPLSPGTVYHYRAVSEGVSSAIHAFHTADPQASSVTFCAYGDSQNFPAVHAAVASLVASCEPDFVLHLGDFLFDVDTPQAWSDLYFTPAASLIASVPVFPQMGNHDIGSTLHDRFVVTAASGTEEWYSFDWGGVHVIGLNTTISHSPGSPQYQWLLADLQSAQASDWIVVFHHYPAFSSGIYGPTASVVDYLVPLYETYGVDLVLSGHEHIYERSEKSGVTYVTSSGGGALLRDGGQHSNPYSVLWVAWIYQFCVVHVTSNGSTHTLECTAYDSGGAEVDSFTLTHSTVPAQLAAFTAE